MLQELLGYHADVLCLQEVDERAFDRYFSPHLRLHGAPLVALHCCAGPQPCRAVTSILRRCCTLQLA